MHDDDDIFDAEVHSVAILEFATQPYIIHYVALRDVLNGHALLMNGPILGLN